MLTAWRVGVGAEETSAVYDAATSGERGAVFVCAHGAGGRMDDRGMLSLSSELRSRGLDVVRFNFLYAERKSGRPDPMPRLMETLEAVVARVRHDGPPRTMLIGGRSMGGRAASMLAAGGFDCDGLLLLAYPLHPAGRPEKLRDEHLPRIAVPTLCLNGTRDELCRRDLMEQVLDRVRPTFQMHWLEGADHSFRVLKSSGRTDRDVLEEVGEATTGWLSRLGR